MASHVDLVGVLFVIWGLLTTLIGVSTLLLGVGAVALIAAATRTGQFAASVTAAIFTTLACMAIAWGLSHVGVGMGLRRRRHASRVLALTLGAVDLVLLPYGTALGCYTLWVLLSEDAKHLFAHERAAGRVPLAS